MSGGYIRSTVCDSPMERRIYKLARQGDSTETFSPSMFPKPSTAAPPPRIRILLAPYMSPYILLCSQVRTWEALHKALHDLFGNDICTPGKTLRITDHRGNRIIPGKWREYLQPNATIIVDTVSENIQDSPPSTFFQHNTYPPTKKALAHIATQIDPKKKMDRNGAGLQRRESEDSFDDLHMDTLPSLGYGPTTLTAPSASLKSRPVQAWEGWASPPVSDDGSVLDEKRNTTITMFTGSHDQNNKLHGAVETIKVESRPIVLERKHTFRGALKKETPTTTTTITGGFDPKRGKPQREPKPATKPAKKEKSNWSRLGKAVMSMISAGQKQKQNRSAPEEPAPGRVNYARKGHARQTASISERRGMPTPAAIETFANVKPNPRRSRSLGSLPKDAISKFAFAPAHNKPTLESLMAESTPSPTSGGHGLTGLARSFSSARSRAVTPTRQVTRKLAAPAPTKSTAISPPIPRRPVGELGTNAQYRTPRLDKAQILESVADQYSDVSSLGTMTHRGTSVSSGTPIETDKPLPQLPRHSTYSTLSTIAHPYTPPPSIRKLSVPNFHAEKRPITIGPAAASKKEPNNIRRYASERR